MPTAVRNSSSAVPSRSFFPVVQVNFPPGGVRRALPDGRGPRGAEVGRAGTLLDRRISGRVTKVERHRGRLQIDGDVVIDAYRYLVRIGADGHIFRREGEI
jgi:hypothetical protein